METLQHKTNVMHWVKCLTRWTEAGTKHSEAFIDINIQEKNKMLVICKLVFFTFAYVTKNKNYGNCGGGGGSKRQ